MNTAEITRQLLTSKITERWPDTQVTLEEEADRITARFPNEDLWVTCHLPEEPVDENTYRQAKGLEIDSTLNLLAEELAA